MAMSPELTVGIAEVDAQHDDLVAQVTAFLETCGRGAPAGQLLPALERLQESVLAHFATEERMMEAAGLPALAPHRARHQGFVQAFLGLKQDLAAQGGTPAMRRAFEHKVAEWLDGHIRHFDIPMGQQLGAARARTSA